MFFGARDAGACLIVGVSEEGAQCTPCNSCGACRCPAWGLSLFLCALLTATVCCCTRAPSFLLDPAHPDAERARFNCQCFVSVAMRHGFIVHCNHDDRSIRCPSRRHIQTNAQSSYAYVAVMFIGWLKRCSLTVTKPSFSAAGRPRCDASTISSYVSAYGMLLGWG